MKALTSGIGQGALHRTRDHVYDGAFVADERMAADAAGSRLEHGEVDEARRPCCPVET